ncbi:type IV secretion system protein [Bartonella refiksaydamii]|uniref:type IV secretion system protein n=1 Tax=Bartonella refiksaydamii TaxID=2654951 RepID=UPI0018DAF595|nr:type IV secretion system protein [Bartonella refiksaydamii]
MRKLIITVVISVILGMSSSALQASDEIPSDDDLDEGVIRGVLKEIAPSLSTLSRFGSFGRRDIVEDISNPPEERTELDIETPISELRNSKIEEQLETLRKQLEEIHQSMVGDPEFVHKGIKPRRPSVLFLPRPEFIYDKKKWALISNEISKYIKQVKDGESIRTSAHDIHELIKKRSKNAAIIDKVISLNVFEEINHRFDLIGDFDEKILKLTDLKSTARYQAAINTLLTLIQNESTKLQMVAHLRNAEQALISQQKHEHNMKILGSKNIRMPKIR